MPKKLPEFSVVTEVEAARRALAPAVRRFTTALKAVAPDKLAKLPQGALADILYDLRGLGKQLDALSAPFYDAIGPTTKAIEDHFINTLAANEASGVQGGRARVQVTASVVPVVDADGWPKLYAYIKKTGSFELLNRAPNREAIRERWDAKKQVPGVISFTSKKVSCTKLTSRRKV